MIHSKLGLVVFSFFIALLTSEAQAITYQVGCTALNSNGVRTSYRVAVNSSIVPASLADENNIIYAAYYPCRDLAQAQLDAVACSKIPLGSTQSFLIGFYGNPSFNLMAFYGDYYMSSSGYNLAGPLVKRRCPYVDPCAALPTYKQAQCRGLE